MRRLLLLSALALAAGRGGAAEGPGLPVVLPPDLALVPPSAVGFVHVKVGDLWKSPAAAGYRALLEKAGPAALAKFDAQFAPRPSTLDRVTVVLLDSGLTKPDDGVVILLQFSAPFDPAVVVAAALAGAGAKDIGGKKVYVTKDGDTGVLFVGTQTLVVGPASGVGLFAALEPAAGPHPLAGALATAAGPVAMTAAATTKGIPNFAQVLGQIPPAFRPAAAADGAVLTVRLAADPEAVLTLTYPSADAATDALRAVKLAANEARKALAPARADAGKKLAGRGPGKARPLSELGDAAAGLYALAGLNAADEFLDAPPVVKAGPTLTVRAAIPAELTPAFASSGIAVGLLLPAVQKVRAAAARATAQNNLKQLALAVFNYESAYGTLPPAAICDKAGKPLLSWRVAVLPYIEQDQLYKQFKLDEPWDSDANKKLIPLMPKVYADPRAVTPRPGETYYKVFTGKDALFDVAKGRKIAGVIDGLSNTLMIAAGGDPVVWTQPDDMPFDPAKPLPNLFQPFPDLLVAMADGSVRVLRPTVKPATLKALVTAAGGEVVDPDW